MAQSIENKNITTGIRFAFRLTLTVILTFFYLIGGASNQTAHDSTVSEKSFDAGAMIMHHIADAHEIHFFTLRDGQPDQFDAVAYLPIILWTDNGLEFFSSSNFYHNPIHVEHGHAFAYKSYILFDEVIYNADEHGISFGEEAAVLNSSPLDLSITKTVAGLLITTFLILAIFLSVARSYRKRPNQSPKGLQSWIEPLVIFVRDDIVRPSIPGQKAEKFMPFLMTVFFFIWIANLLGLMSFLGGYNVMGSMSVTLVLAFLVFAITTYHGNKNYWKHIVWPDNIPFLIKLILVPIEVLQVFMKPLVLMIRLTANITAGHIIILAFTALIFIFGQDSAITGYSVGAGSLLFMVFMFFIELLVAFLQAYVFTLLSAIYFGSAVEEAHH